ncbi:MAG: hypothetical protein Q9159_007249 [Coniocarpon cinnabarinum]
MSPRDRSRSPQRSRRPRSSSSRSSWRHGRFDPSQSPPRRWHRVSPARYHHEDSSSPSRRRRRSRSPSHVRHRPSRSRSPGRQRDRRALPSQQDSYRSQQGGGSNNTVDKEPEKEKPNWKPTGILAAESNKVTVGSGSKAHDIVLKYHEPPEARKPPASEPWVIYVFKGDSKDPIHTVPLHSRTCWLLGRETAVADVPLEHPSCSKQHAVFQFRHTTKTNEYGDRKSKVGLYLLDLDSSNGTFVNDEKVTPSTYVQCLSGDIVKFADSEREYVVMLPPKE